MGKITMQDIADSLGISRITVWKVFNNQPNVSEELKEKILQRARELGYIKNNIEAFAGNNDIKTVSLIVSRPNSSVFWTDIIHCIAQEMSKYNINLLYTYIPATYNEGATLPANITNGSIDGIIAINIYDPGNIKMISKLNIPKVFLDTVPQMPFPKLNGDLMLIEGYNSTCQITEHVIKMGANNIGFIGDINYAQTNSDRYAGFKEAHIRNNLEVKKEFCLTRSLDIYNYYEELKNDLDKMAVYPDAFICINDDIAHFIHMYFMDKQYLIPDGIIITGFDGSREFSNINGLITTANVNTPHIGKKLANQILYRINNATCPLELTYLMPTIEYKSIKFYA